MMQRHPLMHGLLVVGLLLGARSESASAQRGALAARVTGYRATSASDAVVLRVAARRRRASPASSARPGKLGVPTELTWRMPTGWRIVGSRWSAPTSAVVGRDTVFEYHGPFMIETTIVTKGPRRSGPVRGLLTYGICSDVCIPGRQTLSYHVR